VDYHQGDSRDNDNAYPQAWYRDQGIYWNNKSRSELVKVSDDFAQDIRVIGYSEKTNVTGNEYRYSTEYGFESRNGDGTPYSCDIKEIVSTTADGKVYELVNLANGEAQVFADCIPEDLAGAITHRYATVSYKDIEADYSSQFVYFLGDSNSFPFLNPEPEASAWYKTQIVTDNQGVTTTTSYNDQGGSRKYTEYADGTHKTECSFDDGATWTEAEQWSACTSPRS